VHNEKLYSTLIENVKSNDNNVIQACLMIVISLLCHHGESPLPSGLHKTLKELANSTKPDILQNLANGISWSQTNFTEVANIQLLPYVLMGAKSGTMSVKTVFETCLVCMTRIRMGEQRMDDFFSRIPSGKDLTWLTEFCRVGGKLRRLALTQPIITDPDRTLLTE